MEYIVDGYNFAFRSGLNDGPAEYWRKRVAKKLLALASGGDTVTLVWDSRGSRQAFDFDRSSGPVTHVFAPGTGSADDHILDLVRESDSPHKVCVVSDDNGVSHPAHNMGARTASVSDIMIRLGLQPAQRKSRRPEPEEEDDEKPAPPTGAALEEWLKLFGEGEEG